VSVVLLSCIAGTRSAVALYDGAPRPREQVARLSGYVRFVDDAEVSKRGSVFELLPGCHLVGTPDSWGKFDSTGGGVVVPTGRVAFALPMRPAHDYSIELSTEHSGGPQGRAWIKAVERDSTGEVTNTFGPVQHAEDAERCLAEAPR